MRIDDLGPFDTVLDVGGNVGEFAEHCRVIWPASTVTSFEPLPSAAGANRARARGRWWVEEVAIGADATPTTLHYCTTQHSASTIMRPGELRQREFGIRDRFEDVEVSMRRLDEYTHLVSGRTLLKVDVEGAEALVLIGAEQLLSIEQVTTVLVEVNQAPDIFVGSPSPQWIDGMLRRHGLYFSGVLATQLTPRGELVQFDGVWRR